MDSFNVLYLAYFIIVIIYACFGAYIFTYRKDKINMKQVMNLFWISLILRAFDLGSTILFTSKLGIDYEGNLIARVLMFMFGIWGGLIISLLILVPVMFFIFVAINSMVKEFGWKMFYMIVVVIGILVPISNLTGLL